MPPLLLRADISKRDFKEINTVAIENSLERDYSPFDGSYMDGKFASFRAEWEGYSNPDDMINNNIYVWVTVEEQPDKISEKVKLTQGFYFNKGYIYNNVCLSKNGVEIHASEKTKTAHSKYLQQAITDVLTALGAFETTETEETLAPLE